MSRSPLVHRPAAAVPATRTGFFGKVPAKGDFVGRGLDAGFRAGMDEWLQRSVATSRRQLGDGWLPTFLEAPIWRFVLGPGLCGSHASAGVMIPSVDRVGRYFPLVLAAQLPGCTAPGALFHTARDWFDRAEQLILSALDDDFDLDRFDLAASGLGLPPFPPGGDGDTAERPGPTLGGVPDGSGAGSCLWWTLGSDKVRASVLLGPLLPPPENFAALLDGRWSDWGWEPPHGGATLDGLPLLSVRSRP